MALKLKPALAEQAKRQQGTRTDLQEIFPKSLESHDTGKEIATLAGVSDRTVDKASVVLDHGSPSLIDAVRQRNQAAAVANQDVPIQGQHTHHDNNKKDVMICSEQGNAAPYALRRLAKARPDLHARCLAGELTAHIRRVDIVTPCPGVHWPDWKGSPLGRHIPPGPTRCSLSTFPNLFVLC